MHWYLAVIYEPEHILKVSADGKPLQPYTRQSTSRANISSNTNSEGLGKCESSLETCAEAQDQQSEAEIENDLKDFESSCIITTPDTTMKSPTKSDNDSEIYGDESDVNMDEHTNTKSGVVRLSPTVSDYGRNVQRYRSRSVESMVVDELGEDADPSVSLQNKSRNRDGEIDATSFYQPAGLRKQYEGKKRVQNGSDSPEIKNDAEEGGVIVVDDIPKYGVLV